jgi:hypothetical protein
MARDASAPEQRRDRGERGKAGGDGEHHDQAVVEGSGNQVGKELPAHEGLLLRCRQR